MPFFKLHYLFHLIKWIIINKCTLICVSQTPNYILHTLLNNTLKLYYTVPYHTSEVICVCRATAQHISIKKLRYINS